MRLPAELLDAIQQETDKVDRRKLVQATAQLTARYKAADFSGPAVVSEAHRAAYLAVRLPATYAALRRVFAEINLRAPQAGIASMLDLGAGPGTALFAAAQVFPFLQEATLVEADAEWIALGRGEDPSLYRSFTDREALVPAALLVVWTIAAVILFIVVVVSS